MPLRYSCGGSCSRRNKSSRRDRACTPSQLLTYLKLSEKHLGLLINFNVVHLRDGIRRMVNGKPPSSLMKPSDSSRVNPPSSASSVPPVVNRVPSEAAESPKASTAK
ncbi:MAG TPA: GxxExxY protein [Terriglobia bacterium]|nr:GxxExxY protein [Terriglobia bacterium]